MVERNSPALVIRDGRLVADPWRHVDDETALPPAGPITVSFERFEKERATLLARGERLGVRVRADQPAESVARTLPDLSLLVIEIAKFSDGRHFSLARLLRDRHGWQGELRAQGDVLPDQLVYMKRCGYSSFALRADQNGETALRLLSRFSLSYQGSGENPQPLFRRRAS